MKQRSVTYRALTRARWLVALVALLAGFAGLTTVSGAGEAHELRGDVPMGTALRQQIADLEQQQASMREAPAEAELSSALDERDRLGEELSRLAIEIEELRRSARSLVLTSFVSGGPGSEMRYLLDVEGASDLSRLRHLLNGIAEPLDASSERLAELESQADADLFDLVERIEALRAEVASLEKSLPRLAQQEAEARALLVIADAWDRADAAIAGGPYGFAPPEKWEALRSCESTDNYRAISPSGQYRGAYQFDLATWQTVGGTGDPVLAPPLEQDARARELYARRGHQPWPVCGRHLR